MSRPTWVGGLGFTFKWNMGWMHDILTYVSKDPLFRRWEHQHLTFSMLYAVQRELRAAVLARRGRARQGLADENVPGDAWQKAATLRTLYAFMFVHPGKKLLFMGSEFGAVARVESRRLARLVAARQPLHAGSRSSWRT